MFMVKEQINVQKYQFRLTENNTSLVKDKPGAQKQSSTYCRFIQCDFSKGLRSISHHHNTPHLPHKVK